MATKDSTTETRETIADAVNRVIAMTDLEAGQVVEAVLAALNGEAADRRETILDLCRVIREGAKSVRKELTNDDVGMQMLAIEHATKVIESIVADKAAVMPERQLDEEFNDHYTFLTGTVVTARQLFHEVNAPEDDSGKKAEQPSCALIELKDRLDAALYPKGCGDASI